MMLVRNIGFILSKYHDVPGTSLTLNKCWKFMVIIYIIKMSLARFRFFFSTTLICCFVFRLQYHQHTTSYWFTGTPHNVLRSVLICLSQA